MGIKIIDFFDKKGGKGMGEKIERMEKMMEMGEEGIIEEWGIEKERRGEMDLMGMVSEIEETIFKEREKKLTIEKERMKRYYEALLSMIFRRVGGLSISYKVGSYLKLGHEIYRAVRIGLKVYKVKDESVTDDNLLLWFDCSLKDLKVKWKEGRLCVRMIGRAKNDCWSLQVEERSEWEEVNEIKCTLEFRDLKYLLKLNYGIELQFPTVFDIK